MPWATRAIRSRSPRSHSGPWRKLALVPPKQMTWTGAVASPAVARSTSGDRAMSARPSMVAATSVTRVVRVMTPGGAIRRNSGSITQPANGKMSPMRARQP